MWSLENSGERAADDADAPAALPAVSSASFEETYPKHEFSELVRLGVTLGNWIARGRRLVALQPDLSPAAPPGQIAAAD